MKNDKVIFGKPDIRADDIKALTGVLKSGWIGMGYVTQLLEEAFVRFTGAKYAVAVSSGSAGLFLSMLAFGIGKDDEVITSPMTFPATANEIIHTGAEVKFVDINGTGNINVSKIEQAINKKTKAIIPVHLYGRPCDMDEIVKIAKKYELFIIEDGAHTLGATYKGRHIGTIGDTTVFSLYATKNITSAEGGIITTNNKKIAETIKTMRSYGITKTSWSRFQKKNNNISYDTLLPGYNFEIPDLLSALALSQINNYHVRFMRRKQIWNRYNREFKSLAIDLPVEYKDGFHALHLYTIKIDKKRTGMDRETFIKRLNKMGIGAGIHFISLHLHSCYRKRYACKAADFPAALELSNRTLSLPLSSGMTDYEVDRVIAAVKRIHNG